ncbi:MAG: hypothetical protein JWP08_520 [Bryobacterales bacterium]|nr:hypothetical protein [Bryobacterales bacterium]
MSQNPISSREVYQDARNAGSSRYFTCFIPEGVRVWIRSEGHKIESVHKRRGVVMLGCLFCFGLYAFQFGDRYDLNNMSYGKVKSLMLHPNTAQAMAMHGNVEFLAGEPVEGKYIDARGEITDANCYLARRIHSYDHAFCAKACAAAGAPVLFLSDGGKVYVVLTARNAVPLPARILDKLGIPGVDVKGRVLHADGIDALVVEAIE